MSEELTEKTVHDLMRGLAEKVLEMSGVRIDKVAFEWIDTGEMDGSAGFILKSVSMATTTI